MKTTVDHISVILNIINNHYSIILLLIRTRDSKAVTENLGSGARLPGLKSELLPITSSGSSGKIEASQGCSFLS